MVLEDRSADRDADTQEAEITAQDTKPRAYSSRLSYEDQLYIFCLLLQSRLVGQLSPWSERDPKKPHYELLVDRGLAADLLNDVSDTPVTADQLKAVVSRFQGKEPLFSSIPRT